MHPRCFFLRFFLPAALLACFLVSGATVPAIAQEPEVLKGTVKSLGPGVLLLTDASFSDETLPRQDVKVLWDNATTFYYGVTKVPKEEVTPGCRVLVKCAQAGSERKAILVRVIMGRAQ